MIPPGISGRIISLDKEVAREREEAYEDDASKRQYACNGFFRVAENPKPNSRKFSKAVL